QVHLGRDLLDLAQLFLEWIKTALLDVGGVHEGRVIVGDHTLRRVGLRICSGSLTDEIGSALLGALKNLEPGASRSPIWRDLGGFSPATVGVFLEIVTRLHRQIPVSSVNADAFLRRLSLGVRRDSGRCHQSYPRKHRSLHMDSL